MAVGQSSSATAIMSFEDMNEQLLRQQIYTVYPNPGDAAMRRYLERNPNKGTIAGHGCECLPPLRIRRKDVHFFNRSFAG